MPIPLATTTITISRAAAPADTDGYDTAPAASTVDWGVRAQISSPSGRNTMLVGNRTVYLWKLTADPCDLRSDDTVTNAEGETFIVQWARQRRGLGLDHTTAGLIQVEGTG